MAKVTGEFQSDVIRAFKGTLDFYYWRGIPVVRGWPRKPLLPRSPAVQSAGQDWRDNSRALSSLPLSLQLATADEVKDTAYTWKDAWTTAIYGHGVEWTTTRPPAANIPLSERVMLANFVAPGTDAEVTLNINNGAYTWFWPVSFWVPWSTIPFTHYRITIAGRSNQAGQNILADFAVSNASLTPAHAPGPALTIPNTSDQRTSGWLSIDNIPAVDGIATLILKGSNNTVDLLWQQGQVELTII